MSLVTVGGEFVLNAFSAKALLNLINVYQMGFQTRFHYYTSCTTTAFTGACAV